MNEPTPQAIEQAAQLYAIEKAQDATISYGLVQTCLGVKPELQMLDTFRASYEMAIKTAFIEGILSYRRMRKTPDDPRILQRRRLGLGAVQGYGPGAHVSWRVLPDPDRRANQLLNRKDTND